MIKINISLSQRRWPMNDGCKHLRQQSNLLAQVSSKLKRLILQAACRSGDEWLLDFWSVRHDPRRRTIRIFLRRRSRVERSNETGNFGQEFKNVKWKRPCSKEKQLCFRGRLVNDNGYGCKKHCPVQQVALRILSDGFFLSRQLRNSWIIVSVLKVVFEDCISC